MIFIDLLHFSPNDCHGIKFSTAPCGSSFVSDALPLDSEFWLDESLKEKASSWLAASYKLRRGAIHCRLSTFISGRPVWEPSIGKSKIEQKYLKNLLLLSLIVIIKHFSYKWQKRWQRKTECVLLWFAILSRSEASSRRNKDFIRARSCLGLLIQGLPQSQWRIQRNIRL